MNKDRVEGKVKEISGRIERQAGEWTGDTKKQVEGAAKQVEGKLQNAWGQAKDGIKKASGEKEISPKPPRRAANSSESEEESEEVRGTHR